jgi:hypothetical protein
MADGNPHPNGHPRNDSETQSVDFAGQIDQGDPLGGGSCPPDRQFSVSSFGSVTIPFSRLCGPLGVVGNLAVAFALLAAAFIAFRQ